MPSASGGRLPGVRRLAVVVAIVIGSAVTGGCRVVTENVSAFTTDMHTQDPASAQIPDATLLKLGRSICTELRQGKTIDQLGSEAFTDTNGRLPTSLLSAEFVSASSDLCPDQKAKVQKEVGSPTTP